MPNPATGAIAGVGALSGIYSADRASSAADAQADAARFAAQQQYKMYMQGRKDLAPWRKAGGEALEVLRGAYGLGGKFDNQAFEKFTQSPGYQFQIDEAMKNAQRQMQARGETGGGLMRRLMEVSQGHAAGQYGNYLQGLTGISEAGRGVGANLAGMSQNYGQQMAQNAMMQGQIEAQKDITQANIVGDLINTGVGLYGMSQYRPQTPQVYSSSPMMPTYDPYGMSNYSGSVGIA